MKRITLTHEDTRFGLDCCQCGYPFEPGEKAYQPNDGDWASVVACSRRCMIEHQASKPKYRKNVDRYLEIVRWLRVRYCDANGTITTYAGMKPTLYTRLVDAFGARYV